MKAKTTKRNRAKDTSNKEGNLYSRLYKDSPAKQWLNAMTPKKKIGVLCGLIGVLILVIALPLVIGANRLSPVATREDFIGKTFAEAKKLADEVGIRYDINNFNGIYDWESEDSQIMNWVTTVYDENDNFVEYDRYTSHGFKLYKGWRISMGTDVKTDKQKKDEEICNAKEGYTFTYKDGKVDCHKTQETICKEEGKIWYKSSCKTQEEVDEDERWGEAHKACKRYGSNGYAKTLTDCYVGDEYKGKVDGSDEPEQEESVQKQEEQQQEEEQRQPQSATSSSTAYPSGISSTDELEPGEVKSLCNRTTKNLGLGSIKSITNGYPMGYPEEIFVLVGILKDDRTIQCQINWQTWTVKSIRVDGSLVYGE